ncbi:hypothetical protein ACET3Z_028197 [Daucus carota]
MFQTTKHERDALLRSRSKLLKVLTFLKSKGFSEEDVLASYSESPLLERDDFGLPINQKPLVKNQAHREFDGSPHCDLSANNDVLDVPKCTPNPFKEKLKGKIDESSTPLKQPRPAVVPEDPSVCAEWVLKAKTDQTIPNNFEKKICNAVKMNETTVASEQLKTASVHTSQVGNDSLEPQQSDSLAPNCPDDSSWQQVKRKSNVSHPPSQPTCSSIPSVPEVKATTASSMPIYAAISRTLSKNQRKKARRSGGKTPPFKH